MRKSLWLFVILLALIIGGTCYVNASLLEEKDRVQITETVLYGDKSIVEGVMVERNTKYDNFIRWNTSYVVGEKPACDTTYAFSEFGTLWEQRSYEPDGIQLLTTPVVNFDEQESALALIGLDKAMQELFEKTKSGEESSTVIDLSDYLDFYVYEIDISLPGDLEYRYMNKRDIEKSLKRNQSSGAYTKELETELHIVEALTEFFKIPVIENHTFEISVAKNMDGTLHGWGYGSANGGGSSGNVSMGATLDDADGFDLWMLSAYSADKCYFTFNTRTRKENIVDTSYISEGYGLYCLPFDVEEHAINVDELEMVYSLDPMDYVIAIEYVEDRELILLFYLRDGKCIMNVIDAETMETQQEIVYSTEGYTSHQCYMAKNYMVFLYDWDKGVLFTIDENGKYQIEMELDLSQILTYEDIPYFDTKRVAFDWNGETLLVGDSLYDESTYSYKNCGFYLSAFDRNGMIYYGRYESSLDAGRNRGQYNFNCMPLDTSGLKVSW